MYEYRVYDLVVFSEGMRPNECIWIYGATRRGCFTSIESSTCRKDVYDKVQRVDYDKILIFRSDALVFTDSSSKSYIF